MSPWKLWLDQGSDMNLVEKEQQKNGVAVKRNETFG